MSALTIGLLGKIWLFCPHSDRTWTIFWPYLCPHWDRTSANINQGPLVADNVASVNVALVVEVIIVKMVDDVAFVVEAEVIVDDVAVVKVVVVEVVVENVAVIEVVGQGRGVGRRGNDRRYINQPLLVFSRGGIDIVINGTLVGGCEG